MPRKQHTHHYIYKTTCKVTGRYYVGMHSTSNLDDNYIGSGKRLWYSILKHGRENHEREILEMLPNRSSLKNRERELVNEALLQDPMCMNLKIGGEGGNTGTDGMFFGGDKLKAAHEWRKTIKGKKYWSKRSKKLWEDENYRNKILSNLSIVCKTAFKGKQHTEEYKKMIGEINSKKQLGEKNSQFGTLWITNDKQNKKIKKTDKIPFGWKLGRKLKVKVENTSVV